MQIESMQQCCAIGSGDNVFLRISQVRQGGGAIREYI